MIIKFYVIVEIHPNGRHLLVNRLSSLFKIAMFEDKKEAGIFMDLIDKARGQQSECGTILGKSRFKIVTLKGNSGD